MSFEIVSNFIPQLVSITIQDVKIIWQRLLMMLTIIINVYINIFNNIMYTLGYHTLLVLFTKTLELSLSPHFLVPKE